ncbi:MAG: DUF4296 domain-containing protein [Parafilimonas sp.]
MTYKHVFIFLISILFSCTSADRYIPSDVIPLNDMKLIVWDMMQAEEFARLKHNKDSNLLYPKTSEMFQQVMRIRKTDKENFYKSFTYYQSHPILNKILFDSVSAYASRQRQLLYKKIQ